MEIKVKKLYSESKIPEKAHDTDAGFDLFVCYNNGWEKCPEVRSIPPSENLLIGTGVAVAIPKGYCGIIKDKSGLSLKEGLTILGGVIDSSYRGEINVIAQNTTSDHYIKVKDGQKIAQLLILPVPTIDLIETEDLDSTDRGTGGFGSTGL